MQSFVSGYFPLAQCLGWSPTLSQVLVCVPCPITSQCSDVPHFAVLSPIDGLWCCFYFSVIMNHAVLNIHIQVFVWTRFCLSWVDVKG